jgi:hypothetical protein
MKLTIKEKEILSRIKYGDLERPIGLQFANAMRSLWAHYTRKEFKDTPSHHTYLFDHRFWYDLVAGLRTRWTHPTDGNSKTRTRFDHHIEKLRAESECLNRRGGHCENPCPNPEYAICKPALEPADEVDY